MHCLAVCLVTEAEKFEIVDFDAMRDDRSFPVTTNWVGERCTSSIGILKMFGRVRQQSFDDFHAVDLAQKIRMP